MKIFVDANVLFSAAYSQKGKAFDLLSSGLHLITSDYAINEAKKNLASKRATALKVLDKLLGSIEVVASITADSCPIDLPAKDRPIFLAAMKSQATHLLTGDLKDFGPHMNQPKKSAGIIIQTVADFLTSL